MKAICKLTDKIMVEVTAENQKELFKELASVMEIFGEKECGACKSTDILFRVRTVADNDFYEAICKSCHSSLSYGQHKGKDAKTLFPKRKLESGEYSKTGGWHKYIPPKGNDEEGSDNKTKKVA